MVVISQWQSKRVTVSLDMMLFVFDQNRLCVFKISRILCGFALKFVGGESIMLGQSRQYGNLCHSSFGFFFDFFLDIL